MQSVRYLMRLSRTDGAISINKIVRRYMSTHNANETEIGNRQIGFVKNQSPSNAVNIELQIDWDKEMQHIIEEEEHENRSVLAPVKDESQICIGTVIRPSFNLAAYVQKSETLQQLIKLGVDLDKLDRKNFGQFIIDLDFKRDIEPYILLLTKDNGIPIESLGRLFTVSPSILQQSLDDIQTRINYLELKRFTRDEIVSIITRNPLWLRFPTREIDAKLGFFQKHFELTGNEVRQLTVACPKLITYNLMDVQKISFSIREECCFEEDEVKQIVLKCPKLWMKHRLDLMQCYDFILNHMKIENSQLARMPNILENRLFRIKERHGFLKKIGRAQYNPKLELYVPLDELCKGTDEEFVEKIAKRPYAEYDQYLRTL